MAHTGCFDHSPNSPLGSLLGDRCPPPFRALIERCCAFKPEDRPEITAVVADLEAMDVEDDEEDAKGDHGDANEDKAKDDGKS